MQLSTNNLSSCLPLQVGSAIEDFVRLLLDPYSVKCVFVCQTIRRFAFNKKVDMLIYSLPLGGFRVHCLRLLLGSWGLWTGAPHDGFLPNALKRCFRLSGVLLKLCRLILGCATKFLSLRFF